MKIDEPAPFLTADEMAARRGEAIPVVDVARAGRSMGRYPMTPQAATAAVLHLARVARLDAGLL